MPYGATGSIKGSDVATVAFEILRGAAAIPEPEPFIQFYSSAGGDWYLAAEAPRDLSGLGIQAQQLKSPVENEIWVLAWGRRYGDTGTRTYARLYAFDGGGVRTVWQRDELPGGAIKISDNRVMVTYYDLARWGLDPPNSEEYQITQHGLQRLR